MKLLLPKSVFEKMFLAIEWKTFGTTFTIFNSEDLLTFGFFPLRVFKFDLEDDLDLEDEKLLLELVGLPIGGDEIFLVIFFCLSDLAGIGTLFFVLVFYEYCWL